MFLSPNWIRTELKPRVLAIILLGLAVLIFSLIGVTAAVWTSQTVCGGALRDGEQNAQIAFLRQEFREPLPPSFQLSSFQCSGFQDLEVQADLQMSYAEGQSLISALEETYLEPQNGKYLDDSSKEKLLTTFPDKMRYTYTLPGTGILYVRKLEVFIPDDATKLVSVKFEGFQY